MTLRRCHMAGLSFLVVLATACDRGRPFEPALEARSTSAGPSLLAPSGASAVAVSYQQVDVSWQDNSSNESGFEVHRSTTGPGGPFTLLATVGANVTSYGNGGLTASTQYCYEVRAFRTIGGKMSYSAFSGTACAMTAASPAPSAVHAAPDQGRSIAVTWADNSTNEYGFRVERSTTGSGPWSAFDPVGVDVTFFDDVWPPAAEQPACYRVFALLPGGDSPASTVSCTAIPATPGNLIAQPGDLSVTLAWTDNSSVEDGYRVRRIADGAPLVDVILPANTTSYRDTGLAPDNTYWYEVRAAKDGGTSEGVSVQVVLASTPPAAPTNLGVQPQSSSSAYGVWADQSTNESGFRVERSIDDGASWVTAVTTATNENYFNDLGLTADQQACYRIVAFNDVGDSPPSNVACTTPPAAPTDLTARIVDTTALGIEFTWTDNSAVEDGYDIFVDDGYGNLYLLASVPPNTTSFRYDAGGTNAYGYAVAAFKDGGYSDFSNFVYPSASSGFAGLSPRSAAPARAPAPTHALRTAPRNHDPRR